MTQEAINELKKYTLGRKNTEKAEISVLQINRIIKALSQEPNGYVNIAKDLIDDEEDSIFYQEPCDDAISREAVLSKIQRYNETEGGFSLINSIKELPSVTQKSGKWIKVTNGRGGHECDICHEYAPSYQDGDEYLTKFCPNCGAKMVESQESEVSE